MNTRHLAIAAALALLLAAMGCERDAGTHRIQLQTDGSVSTAAIAWRDGSGAVRVEQHAELPWILEYEATEGTPVFISVSSGDTSARLWIRVLEDDREVLIVPGCQCNGIGVSAQASGNVGDWAP